MASSGVFASARRAADVLQAARGAMGAGDEPVRVGIYVAEGAPDEMVGWVRDAFVPLSDAATITVERVPAAGVVRVHSSSDLVVFVAGAPCAIAGEFLLGCAADGTPCAVLAESALEAPEIGPELPEGARLALVTATSRSALESKLARWVVDVLPDSRSAARGFSFVRPAHAKRVVSDVAGQNAMVGALGVLSGAHMPIMTAGQAKMALDLAGAYGARGLRETVPPVLGVVAAGFAYRGVARAAQSRVPAAGMLVRAAVAAGGTLLSGAAVRAYLAWARPGARGDAGPSQDGGLVKRRRT